MTAFRKTQTFFAALLALGLLPASAGAQEARSPAADHIGPIARECIDNWESAACIQALAQSNLVLAANYAEKLQNGGQRQATEAVKEHCAASTAATRQEVPAYAMRSAMTECANALYEISQQTGIEPDQGHYQLLVYPTMCLSGDASCEAIEQGLAEHR